MTQQSTAARIVRIAGASAVAFLASPLFIGVSPVDWPWWLRIPYWIVGGYVSASVSVAVWRINTGQVTR